MTMNCSSQFKSEWLRTLHFNDLILKHEIPSKHNASYAVCQLISVTWEIGIKLVILREKDIKRQWQRDK